MNKFYVGDRVRLTDEALEYYRTKGQDMLERFEHKYIGGDLTVFEVLESPSSPDASEYVLIELDETFFGFQLRNA